MGNTSWQIIEAFKKSLISLYNLPEHRIRISQKIVNGKPYYKAVLDDMKIGRFLNNKYGTFRTLKYSLENGRSFYPSASLPVKLQNPSIVRQFLKLAFSCDGGINLYVVRKKYTWLIRNVYLSCQHPVLLKQYFNLLKKIGIQSKILWKDELIRIQGRKDLEKFANEIGFLDGVKITQHSTYWQGFEKQRILQRAIASYGNPKIIYNLPQFRVKI